MKKLGRLQINSEKLMTNDQLLILRGGYDGGCCVCFCDGAEFGAMAAVSAWDCSIQCDGVCAFDEESNYSEGVVRKEVHISIRSYFYPTFIINSEELSVSN